MFVIRLGLFVVMLGHFLKLYYGKHKVIIIDRKDSQNYDNKRSPRLKICVLCKLWRWSGASSPKSATERLSGGGVGPVQQQPVEDSQLRAPGEAYHIGWQSH